MAEQEFIVHSYPAWKGLNKNVVPGTADNASIQDCDNIVLSLSGSKRKAPGTVQYNRGGLEFLTNPRFGNDFWRTAAGVQNQSIVVGGGGKLFADSGDGLFTDITGTASFGIDAYMSTLVYVGLMILFIEGSVPYKYTMSGDIVILGGSPPVSKYGQKFRRRTFLAGNPAAPHRLYRCDDVDDPESGYVNYLDIDAGAGGGDEDPVGITALFPQWRDYMVVSKRNSLYIVYYTADATFPYGYRPMDASHGCIEHNTVVAVPNDIIYVSERGVHSLAATDKYGDTEAAFLSANLQGSPSWWSKNVDVSKAEYFWGEYIPTENSYYLLCRNEDTDYNHQLLIYNLELKEWTVRKNWPAGAIFRAHDPLRFRRLMRLSTTNLLGEVTWNVMGDFGQKYNAEFESNIIIPKAPWLLHTFTEFILYYGPKRGHTSLSFTYEIDGVEIETLNAELEGGELIGKAKIGTSKIGTGAAWQRVTLPLKGLGTAFKYKIEQEAQSLDDEFEIFGYTLKGTYDDDELGPLSLEEV